MERVGSNLGRLLKVVLAVPSNFAFVHLVHFPLLERLVVFDVVVIGVEHQPRIIDEDTGDLADHWAVADLLGVLAQDAAEIKVNDRISERCIFLHFQVDSILKQSVEEAANDAVPQQVTSMVINEVQQLDEHRMRELLNSFCIVNIPCSHNKI